MPPTITESSVYALDATSAEPSMRRPTLAEIGHQLLRIDGSTFDQLYIEGDLDDGTRFFACVDDGTGGNVVLNVGIGDQANYLVGNEPTNGEPEYALITSGGQETDTLTRWVVTLDRAARGLWFFLATGQLDPGLQWEQLVVTRFEPPRDAERQRLPRKV
jgi:hypothetical protein